MCVLRIRAAMRRSPPLTHAPAETRAKFGEVHFVADVEQRGLWLSICFTATTDGCRTGAAETILFSSVTLPDFRPRSTPEP
jgi:hypothetical protein